MAGNARAPGDYEDDVENVEPCASCYGDIGTFDKRAYVDFDSSGPIEGIQTEVSGLMKRLALRLPPSVELDASVRGIPEAYALAQNYPNPFNAETVISYSLTKDEPVVLEVRNTIGQRVRTLVQASQQAGAYIVRWDGRDDQGHSLGSGIYFYRLEVGTFSSTKRMTLLQ